MGGHALRWNEYRSVPWKNGGGMTRQVASGTLQAPMASAEITDGFDWRVSVADVDAEGPFSTFPGIDRVITLVEGEGMVLTVDGTPHPVGPLSPFAFSGDAATDCRLEAGAVRNVNVMTRRSRATATVRIVTVAVAREAEMACAAGETLLVMAVTEGTAIGGPDGRETTLGRLDCVRHEGPAALTLRGDGMVTELRITAAG
ncbi:HutD family protein [Streptomyces sp. SAI-127]|uniref:HutD family protein n=1 Tax=Streptomyces sp. SAI-127 TaxID=2940543 RepID=UPI002475B208|nr:HutD family protein [Streptomyces sp. SAI-127]MDH6484587.1 environmental stress-induced protein Ves [Streptomyces sp. SAI-127]